jgi:hypothetical protein
LEDFNCQKREKEKKKKSEGPAFGFDWV